MNLHTIIIPLMHILSLNVRGLRSREKIESLFTSIQCDILCLQETKWDNNNYQQAQSCWKGPSFFSEGPPASAGVAIFSREGACRDVKLVHRDKAGRLLVIDIDTGKFQLRIINVYASNRETERKIFFKELATWCSQECMFVGDFNVALTKSDISINNVFKEDGSRAVLFKTIQDNNLMDVWRVLHPNKRGFSRRQLVLGKLKQSRIDLCIATPGVMSKTNEITHVSNAWSDHDFIDIQFDKAGKQRNGGLWYLNNSLLQDQQLRVKIIKTINQLKEVLNVTEDVPDWWEQVKLQCKSICIKYSKKKKWLEQQEEKELRDMFTKEAKCLALHKDRDTTLFTAIKLKLDEIEIKRCRGAVIRARAQHLLEGEKSTAYFLGLEKERQKKTFIKELKNKHNQTVNNTQDILDVVQGYYKNLFSKEEISIKNKNIALEALSQRLSAEDRLWCDSPLTLSEVESAIDGLNNNKSPGTDGLTGEFYKAFKNELAPVLLRVLNEMQATKSTPKSFTLGVVTLVYKCKGQSDNLDNYRPISLLNTDYKILAKILANRLKNVINSIISPYQSYSIPKRDISDTVLSVKHIIQAIKQEGGIYLGIDFNKAFDRVDHDFLWGTLEKFGFGKIYINWLKLMYENARSIVKVNGHLTSDFKIERSVRQGCPLSSLLFSIVTEPLALMIAQDPGIKGITTPCKRECKIVLYADDTNIMVRDEDSVGKVLEHLETYCKASGAKINTQKSEIMYYGPVSKTHNKWQFHETTGKIKVLGVFLGENLEAACEHTWGGLEAQIKNKLALWKMRALSLRGRAVVVNTLLLSKLNHVLMIHHLPRSTANRINNIMSQFIWKASSNQIAHNTVIGKYQSGGLNLIDLNSKMKAFRVKLIQKLLQTDNNAFWKDYVKDSLYSCGKAGLYNLCQTLPQRRYEHLDPFMREVMEAWGKVRPLFKVNIKSAGQILQQPLCHNAEISEKGRPLVSGALEKAKIDVIGDIMDDKGNMSLTTVINKLKLQNVRYRRQQIKILIEKLQVSLPSKWKEFLNKKDLAQEDAPNFFLSCHMKGKLITEYRTKTFYKILIDQIHKPPTAEKAWAKQFPKKDIPSIWLNINENPIPHAIFNTDFKLRHRKIYTGIILHQINKHKYGRDCAVCVSAPETLEHMFFECAVCQPFLSQVRELLEKHCGLKRTNEQHWKWTFLFGLDKETTTKGKRLLNLILAFARHTLYLARNLMLHEGKKTNRWAYFTNTFKAHCTTLHKGKKGIIEHLYTTNNTLFQTTQDGTLHFNF